MLKINQKSLNIANLEKIFILKLKFKKILILQIKNCIKKYFVIPSQHIYISYNKEQLILKLMKFSSSTQINQKDLNIKFENFYSSLNNFNKHITYFYKKTLKIKGLGLRVNFSENLKSLVFKLGFSHLINLVIPEEIFVSLNKKKKYIVLESIDNIKLNKFTDQIKILKTPNAYKGKGIFFKHTQEKLKVIKKK